MSFDYCSCCGKTVPECDDGRPTCEACTFEDANTSRNPTPKRPERSMKISYCLPKTATIVVNFLRAIVANTVFFVQLAVPKFTYPTSSIALQCANLVLSAICALFDRRCRAYEISYHFLSNVSLSIGF